MVASRTGHFGVPRLNLGGLARTTRRASLRISDIDSRKWTLRYSSVNEGIAKFISTRPGEHEGTLVRP
jgi:hypothetical protein